MESSINKLFEYFDTLFFEERVEVDEWGKYGTHYQGLFLDTYLAYSVFSIDYLSIEDYFETVAGVKYCETDSLYYQYGEESIETRLKVISAILTLINASSHNTNNKQVILNKSKAFLKRFGLELEEEGELLKIKNEYKLFEGSYCDIYLFNELLYKKQLKSQYRTQETWKKRFKYEYENMLKLVESPYVLKVFNYDELNDSYLMEKCDCNIFDYLNNNPFVDDEKLLQLINEILLGMKDVHDAGIIHRDLHLGNLLIKDGQVILSDFGLSKDTMINHSLMSTSTPKNSHYFIDPIGLSSFKLLDKLSDIYSVGKIIEYITRNSDLNKKLSFVIGKATDRDRRRRYSSIDEFIADVESSTKEISKAERIEQIENKIAKAEISPDVEEFIVDLLKQEQLSIYVVKRQLYNFGKLLLQFNETDQVAAFKEMNINYSEATGYGHFENYDIFATISDYVIRNSNNIVVQRSAYNLLKGCAQYRYSADKFLSEIDIYYPILREK